MTSTPQQGIPQTQTSTVVSQSAAHTQTSSVGTNLPSFGRSTYAAATRKISTPNAFESSNMSTAVGGAPPSHSHSDSVINRNPTVPAVPSIGPTIVNGNNPFPPNDHSRKPSMTVTPAGVTGFTTNGGAGGHAPNKTAGIRFGSVNEGGSPAPGTPPSLSNQPSSTLGVAALNPRIASPQN